MRVSTSNARHILLRVSDARLPDALLAVLRDEVVLSGWLRASGVLTDVVLRIDGQNPNAARRIAGPVHAVVIDGSVGLANGDASCGLRAVLTRETETGVETIAGEIVEARVVAMEAHVTAFDDVASARERDASGVWLLAPGGTTSNVSAKPAAIATTVESPVAPLQPPPAPPPAPQPIAVPEVLSSAATVQAPPVQAPPPPPRPPAAITAPMPARPARPQVSLDEEHVYPDAGDTVEHFAFGRCEVIKSDGDRLHLRLGKDGKIKEIALEMLKITPLPAEPNQSGKHYKLDRKL